jgi:hypothetical protein
MRRLFLVLAKLLGLLLLYSGLMMVIQISGYFATSGASGPVQRFGNIYFLVESFFFFVVSLGIAWLLLARTDWLANKLGIGNGPEIIGLEPKPLLLVGVTLIGVYATAHAIPALAGELVRLGLMKADGIEWRSWGRVISSVVQLGLGLFLMLMSPTVVKILARVNEMMQPTDESQSE